MDGIHDVRTSGLSQVVELAKHRPIVEVEIKNKNRFFLESMLTQGDLGWNKFGVGILDHNVFNGEINQGRLCKFVGTISKLLDVDSHIIFWVAMILDVESQSLNLSDPLLKLGVIITQENTIVHVDHEDMVSPWKNTQSPINEAV